MIGQVAPEWLKAHKSMSVAMGELDAAVKELDVHFAGKVQALKAKAAQDGPRTKILTQLRTDTKMVRKALEANRTQSNGHEVDDLIDTIDHMFSEGGEVWDTHAGITDEKKTDKYVQKSLKRWNEAAKKVKDKAVKKAMSKSKVPKLLQALSKSLAGVGAAERGLMGHNAKFNQTFAHFEGAMHKVAEETKCLAAALKKAQAAATKMERTAM